MDVQDQHPKILASYSRVARLVWFGSALSPMQQGLGGRAWVHWAPLRMRDGVPLVLLIQLFDMRMFCHDPKLKAPRSSLRWMCYDMFGLLKSPVQAWRKYEITLLQPCLLSVRVFVQSGMPGILALFESFTEALLVFCLGAYDRGCTAAIAQL